MKRLKLNVEELLVESFASTDAPTSRRGTVHAHAQATYACTEGWDSCQTQEESCGGTCIDPGTCGYFSQCMGWCESQHDSCSCQGSCTNTICAATMCANTICAV
jgi:hypothetical protein